MLLAREKLVIVIGSRLPSIAHIDFVFEKSRYMVLDLVDMNYTHIMSPSVRRTINDMDIYNL